MIVTYAASPDQTSSEISSKLNKEVANPELQYQLVQQLNESFEKSSIQPKNLPT